MKHFDESEFQCSCGECGLDYDAMQPELLERLDDAREQAGIPFVITSSIRCAEHNRAVGGAPNSAHTRGYAVDIAAHGSRERYLIVEGARKAGFTRIGIANSFVHVDADPSLDPQVIWTYS